MTWNEGEMDRVTLPIRLLAESGRIGFACLDENFITQFRFGKITEWIPLGKDICSATPVFFGLEQDLLQLKDEPTETLVVSKVGLNREQNNSGKVSIECTWHPGSASYIISVYSIGDECDFEHDLVNQMRRARVAEENYRTANEQLSKHHDLLSLLVHLPIAIAVFDRDMRYMFLTQRWATLFSLECEPLLDRSLYDSCLSLFSETAHLHQRCLEGGIVEDILERFQHANGDRHWIKCSCNPWHRTDKSIGGLIICCDLWTAHVTERATFQQRNDELLRANQELERFASIISHDLRAPLQVLRREIKLVESIIGSHIDDGLPGSLSRIMLQCERMMAMVTDLFEYSVFNEISRITRKINFIDFVSDILKGMPDSVFVEFRCKTCCIEIDIALAPLDLVMRNLIENAAKHHDRATCNIIVAIEDRGDEWAFSVSDDGPGMAAAEPRGISRATDGASSSFRPCVGGIGLALVRKTVELQGGRVNVTSAPGEHRGTFIEVLWPKPHP